MPSKTTKNAKLVLMGLSIFWSLVFFLSACQVAPSSFRSGIDLTEPGGKLAMVVFDVGQAGAIFVLAPNGKSMLVDAGNSADDARNVILPYLSRNGVKRLDYLVLTHPHQDHVGGMPAILRGIEVSTAVFSGQPHANGAYEQFLSIIRERKTPALQARQGKSLDLGPDVKATILNPPEPLFEDLNDSSVVIRVAWRDVSFLLTGDVEAEAESAMLRSGSELVSTVLQVAHHGSGTSSSPRFLDAVKPRYAVISVGANNDYGHPHKRTLDKLETRSVTTLRTDLNGTVVFSSDGSKVEVAKEK